MPDEIQPADARTFNNVHNYGGTPFMWGVISFMAVSIGILAYGQFTTKAVTPVVHVVVPVVTLDITGPDSVEIGELAEFEVVAKVADPQWLVFPKAKIKSHGTIAYLETRTAGEFTLLCIGVKDGKSWYAEHQVTIGQSPIPPPVPPTPPTPPVPPGPVVGPRTAVLIYESSDNTPELARLITALRAGEQSNYLKSKGHSFYVLDKDSIDPDGKASAVLETWRPHFTGMALPALMIADGQKKLISKTEIKPGMTAADVVSEIKKAGG